MALHLEYQPVLGTSFVEIDMPAQRLGNIILKFSDSAPASLEFTVTDPQHTMPLELRKYIRFWDDEGTTPDGDPQSNGNPLFEGFIWECQPAESNLLRYLAYDPSHLAGVEIPVMSTDWDPAVGTTPPQPGLGAVPRIIFNATIKNDADYAFERAHDVTVGDIIQIVLDDAILPLRWYQAAPGGDVAYQTSDLGNFIYKPQEKIVSTNESLRGFLERLTQQHYPEYAFRWDPGTHYWRWYSRLAAPEVTLTLNDPDPPADRVVLSMELHRSLEGRYPAVRIYGPETTVSEIFTTQNGTLIPIDEPVTLETYVDAGGIATTQVHSKFQIVDPAKRRGARLLPGPMLVRDSDFFYIIVHCPLFEITFDGGYSWQGVRCVHFDFQNGIIDFGQGLYTYVYSSEPAINSSQHFFVPNGHRVIWAPYVDPLVVRAPIAGYEGTSHTIAGQTSEFHLYDEMLAVGYNRIGIPVTTEIRLAQYQLLAEALLAAKKDIIYAGGTLLEGLQYEFSRLERRINLAAIDEDGNSLTTGWEGIKAVVSDVEYDFSERTTTLTFSQDTLVSLGDNIDLLKRRLRILGPYDRVRIFNYTHTWRHAQSVYSNTPGGYNVWSGVIYNDYDLWWNRDLGTFERGITPWGEME